jgi:hypothetical protein
MRDTPHRVPNFTFCADGQRAAIRIKIQKAFEENDQSLTGLGADA